MTDKTTPISVKQKTYEIEARFLSPYAMKSDETKAARDRNRRANSVRIFSATATVSSTATPSNA